MNAWEQDSWADNVAAWTGELADTPGVFGGLCQMDTLDVLGAEEFVRWYRAEREAGS